MWKACYSWNDLAGDPCCQHFRNKIVLTANDIQPRSPLPEGHHSQSLSYWMSRINFKSWSFISGKVFSELRTAFLTAGVDVTGKHWGLHFRIKLFKCCYKMTVIIFKRKVSHITKRCFDRILPPWTGTFSVTEGHKENHFELWPFNTAAVWTALGRICPFSSALIHLMCSIRLIVPHSNKLLTSYWRRPPVHSIFHFFLKTVVDL